MTLLPKYLAGQSGVLKFAPEAAMIDPLDTATIASSPAFQVAGYGSVPSMSRQEGSQVINAVGSYTGVATKPMARIPTANANVRLGNANFLRYGLRSSGLTPAVEGLPVIAVQGGSAATGGFNEQLRFAAMNGFGIQFQEGQPVGASVNFIGVALEHVDLAASAMDFATDLSAAEAEVFTWYNATFMIGGVSYREFLAGVSLQVSNNVQPIGGRLDQGWDNSLSRAPYGWIPGLETVQVSYQLHAGVGRALIDAAQTSGDWGSVVLSAANVDASASMQITIANNMLTQYDMQAIEAGQPFGYSANTVGRVVTIAAQA